jgi:hypothetical protein
MEPPSPPLEGRSGVLFEDASDKGYVATNDNKPSAVDVFPVNNPPKRRKDTVNSVSRANSNAKQRSRSFSSTDKVAKSSQPSVGQSSVSGMAVNPSPVERPPDADANMEFLDDRNVADLDELYGENERALSNFVRLHPMLRY